jgi:hypothetical protein
MSAMSRFTSCSAVSTSVTPRFVSYAYRPSSRRDNLDSATGPRAPYRTRRKRPSRSFALTQVSACSENPIMTPSGCAAAPDRKTRSATSR